MARHDDALKLRNVERLIARVCAGAVHAVERISFDGPGRTLLLHDSEGRTLLVLSLDDPTWRIAEDGGIEWP